MRIMESNMVDVKKLKTPCFIIDEIKLQNNIIEFKNALNKFFDSNVLAYSVKTNSLPYIIWKVNELKCYLEVVSYDEYNLVRKLGINSQNIIYNGPMKDKKTFFDALKNGFIINIETWKEIEWLEQFDYDVKAKIGVRVNIDLEKLAPYDVDESVGKSRFGFEVENGQLKKAIEKIQKLGYQVGGLHLHRTSKTRSLNVYDKICKYANEIIDNLQLNIEYLDIGGGFFGDYPGKPDYIEYINTIRNALKVQNIMLIIEPGNALVASPINYMLSIIDKKISDNRIVLTTDGSRIDIDPMFHKKKYDIEIYTKNKEICEEQQFIAGCTCLENDIITILDNNKKLNVGDRICFNCQGAYTSTLTPNFIRLLPKVYAFDGSNYRLVREKVCVDDWILSSLINDFQEKNAILFSNAGRRATLIKDFKKSLGFDTKIIATDNWSVAPALFVADQYYLTPKITEKNYIDILLEICKKNNVKAITTCIDPEISIMAENRDLFLNNGILPLCPSKQTADICFDKYKMFLYLKKNDIPTVLTYSSMDDFNVAYRKAEIKFPVFIKPRSGSGSVGISKVKDYTELKEKISRADCEYIIQEYMDCQDCDADVYIDTISNEVVSAFLKKKIETRIGGASKTVSFKDSTLFELIKKIVNKFEFYGPIDMDFFIKDGHYYLSEINPRFGGGYLHAYESGVDFSKLIYNNIFGKINKPEIGEYKEGTIMLMYDEVIMTDIHDLKGDYND